MPFQDTKEGSTHYEKDDCKKCKDCNAHYTGINILPVNLCRDCVLHLMKEVAVKANEEQMKIYKQYKQEYDDFKEQADNNDLTNI